MDVPILRQGSLLIATLQGSPTDEELRRLRAALAGEVVRHRSRGVVIDVTALEVIDSFASRMLGETARIIRMRGARTVVVGIRPEVALAMVQMGLRLEDVPAALDLEEGMAELHRQAGTPP